VIELKPKAGGNHPKRVYSDKLKILIVDDKPHCGPDPQGACPDPWTVESVARPKGANRLLQPTVPTQS